MADILGETFRPCNTFEFYPRYNGKSQKGFGLDNYKRNTMNDQKRVTFQ